MHILFLGPPCERIEEHLWNSGHIVVRTEASFDVQFLEDEHIQFGISYRYKKIIRQGEINWFSGRLVNLHISLLPWNRGYDPNIWSMLEDTPSGVSIHLIDKGIDTGDILIQKEISIDKETATLASSWEHLGAAIETLFIENSNSLLQMAIPPRPQNSGGSFHLSVDKIPYAHLWQEKGWNTPVAQIIGKAKRDRCNVF